ncbi:MAG: alpha/beta fold hydrolase [Kineosporiaceae bacterium]|nr:alpha/beta fold hydrolase [Kineosporiaceae bacterium]
MSAGSLPGLDAATARRAVQPISMDDAPDGVLPRFRAVLAAQPHEIAVADAERHLTYRGLAAEAAAVLRAVRGAGTAGRLPEGAPIALLHPHEPGAVSSLLGILASGHPVVVLDPRTPPARLRVFVERSGAAACLVHPDTAEAGGLIADQLVLPDLDGAAQDDADLAVLFEKIPDPQSPAALAFTSGSTGLPKVVVNNHRMLVRDAWTNSIDTGCYGADDVVAHTLPLAFHAGLMVTVAGLLVGSRMELYDVRGAGIAGLPAWLARVGATVMHSSPAILRAFVGTRPDPALLTALRSLTIAGEAAHGRDVEAARALLPAGCVVRNRYGSSETGLIAEYAVPADHPPLEGPLPVGRPVGDTLLQITAEDGSELPDGEPGVLTVTTDYLASGYWNDPEATAAAFSLNPDGRRTYRTSDVGRFDTGPSGRVLRLLGRRDHSVKIRGYLVEPGEVDAALFALPDVTEAVTVAALRPGAPTDSDAKRLVSYVVSTAEQPSAAEVRKRLRAVLAGHMVPEAVVFLKALPRTDRGKLDRSALPEPPAIGGPETYGPMSDWEQAVADLWAGALELPSVGPDDDFFELGGDSLAAEAILSSTIADLGVPAAQVTATVLTEAPTVRQFAARVQRAPDALGALLVPLQRTGSRPPVFFIAGGGGLGVAFVAVARRLGADQPSYAVQMHGMERRGVPDWTVARAARRNLTVIRTVQPRGPYVLAGHSYGGLVALEMAHQLRAAGEEVALLAVLDSFPPEPSMHPAPEPRSLARRIRAGLGLAATGWATPPGGGNYWRFYDLTSFIGRHYRTNPYPGRAMVVVADSPEKVQRSAWAKHLTGEWSLVDVGGDHLSMLREPHAADVAACLVRALEQVREDDGGG